MVLTSALWAATSFLISVRRRAVMSFCSFFRSARAALIDLTAALSAATAALLPDFSSERRSASTLRSMSRILSDLFSDRCRASRSFRISILRPVASFSSTSIVFFKAATVALEEEEVETDDEELEPTVGVAVLVPDAEPVEEANAFPDKRIPTRTAAIPAFPMAIETDFPVSLCMGLSPFL